MKAGTATVGKQSATDNKGTNQTGNFVTGLDNTTWNMADPAFVSGRAATEDQLKALEKDIQKATDDAVKKIDSMTAEKEKELLTV